MGDVAVVSAAGDVPVELGGPDVALVRRCDDLEDLLSAAAAGVADAAVVSAYLPGLDRDALSRLGTLGLVVIGVTAGDEPSERRLRQLGVRYVHTGQGALADLLLEAAAERTREQARAFANPFAALTVPTVPTGGGSSEQGRGRVVAVWGPTGAPGRSTVALGLAGEIAVRGWPTLLLDADTYGGTLAPSLGLLDESSGLAAACRAANRGALDVPALAALTVQASPSLSVLSGLPTPERWPELRPSAMEVVLRLSRAVAAVSVVDCGFSLEQDEELSYDTLAPRRNGATLAVLEQADLVVVVGSAEGQALTRLVRGIDELRQAVPGVRTAVVVNRVRPSVTPEGEIRSRLRRFADVERVTCLPLDVAAADASLAAGRGLHAVAPGSPLQLALEGLAVSLVGAPSVRSPRRLFAR